MEFSVLAPNGIPYFDDWRVFDRDAQTGVLTLVRNTAEDGLQVRQEQECDGIVAHNREIRNETANKRCGDVMKVASVPISAYFNPSHGLMEARKQGDQAHVHRWLGENSKFLATDKRL